MEYNDFIQAILEEVQERQIKYVRTTIFRNGKEMDAIILRIEDTCQRPVVNPVLYLEEVFKNYNCGMEVSEIIKEVIRNCNDSKEEVTELAEIAINFDEIKPYITCKVVNRDKNRKHVETKRCLHKEFLDLYVIPIVVFKDYILEISDAVRKIWDVKEEEIFNVALSNLKNEKILCMNLCDFLQESLDGLKFNMYVVSNPELRYGASKLLVSQIWEEISNKLGDTYYWIIPSSVHECLVIPFTNDISKEYVKSMIRDVNAKEVKEEDFLSNNLYEYKEGKITISEGGINE